MSVSEAEVDRLLRELVIRDTTHLSLQSNLNKIKARKMATAKGIFIAVAILNEVCWLSTKVDGRGGSFKGCSHFHKGVICLLSSISVV